MSTGGSDDIAVGNIRAFTILPQGLRNSSQGKGRLLVYDLRVIKVLK
jgi:hypothetical protein